MRTRTALTLILLAALVPVVAACGSDTDPADPGAPGAGETPAPEPETHLEMTVWPAGEGEGEPERYTLSCDPPAGEHPDPAAACSALAELGAAAFAPVPADTACTQQYGGPMQAEVRGTVDGEQVDARLAYTDGCQIARWNALADVVPHPGGELR